MVGSDDRKLGFNPLVKNGGSGKSATGNSNCELQRTVLDDGQILPKELVERLKMTQDRFMNQRHISEMNELMQKLKSNQVYLIRRMAEERAAEEIAVADQIRKYRQSLENALSKRGNSTEDDFRESSKEL